MQWETLRPKYMKILGGGKRLNPGCGIETDVPIIRSAVEEAAARFFVYEDRDKGERYQRVVFRRGMDTQTVNRIRDVLGDVYADNDEGYFIDSTGADIIVRSASERGLFYGAQALAVFLETPGNVIPSMVAYEYPTVPERGVKCYIPGVHHIAFFKQFVDMMARYRHNTLLLEIGGAMEYKRHPEINTEWIKYCQDIREYSGKSSYVQEATYTWRKNSMHVENGDGGFISQDMVRELVAYCRERYIDVIPEVLSLSHCDYIVRAYPEIAEHRADPYPDTYCPSHPKTYRILFSILDEILDVFEPDTVHIGHDEYYLYQRCPRCKGREAPDIYADDVNTIYDYLHARSLKMMMWSEKLLNSYTTDGRPAGGAKKYPAPAWGDESILCDGMEATWPAIDKVPRDIKMLHWYWSWDETYEREYLKRNMPATYGNYRAVQHTNYKARMERGMLGGLCSNWSTLSELIMQWNGVIFATAFNGTVFWDPDYDFNQRDETLRTVASDLYRWRNADALHGEKCGNYIRVKHTTTRDMPYEGASDGVFLDRSKYLLGHYVVTCENGRTAKIPVHYGECIASMTDRFGRETEAAESADGTVQTSMDKLMSVSYQALPLAGDGGTWYDAVLRVPDHCRGFKITDVRFEQTAGDCEVRVGEIEVL